MLLALTFLTNYVINLICLRIKHYQFRKMFKKLYVEDKDVDDLLKSVLKTSNYELIESDLQQPEAKIGLFGDHAFLKTCVRVGSEKCQQELHFFLKYFPNDEVSDEFAKESKVFTKETVINGEIFYLFDGSQNDLIYKCVPKCYLQREDYVLIFEDLTKTGYQIIDKTTVCNFEVMHVILKSLAQLHASSLVYEEKKSKELKKPYTLIDEYQHVLHEAFYSSQKPIAYASAIASIKALQTEIQIFDYPESLPSGKNFKGVANKLSNEIFDLVKPSQKYRNVICHGDLWYSNIFLKFSDKNVPIDCKFVDFQLYRYTPPSHDVMAAIFLNTTEEFRNKHLYELIGLYYTALERHLKLAGNDINKIIPFNTFLESCEEQKLFAILQSALYAQLIYLDGDVLAEFFSNTSLCEYALHEDRSVLVLAHVNNNEYYRKKLQDTVLSLWNYCQWL